MLLFFVVLCVLRYLDEMDERIFNFFLPADIILVLGCNSKM